MLRMKSLEFHFEKFFDFCLIKSGKKVEELNKLLLAKGQTCCKSHIELERESLERRKRDLEVNE